MKIKLIFGSNGKGKTKYFEEKINNVDYITLNYDIAYWYNEEKKLISHEMFFNKKWWDEIENIGKDIYKDKESFGKIKKSDFDSFLKEIDFFDFKIWYHFWNENKHKKIEENFEKNIESYISIKKYFDKYKNIINNLTNEQFEFMKLYNSFKFDEIKDLKEERVIYYQNKILDIKNEIFDNIKKIENLNELIKIDKIVILDKIKQGNWDINKLIEIIKLKIVHSEKAQEIFKLFGEIEENKKHLTNFKSFEENIKKLNSKYNVSEDGFSITNVDLSPEQYSNGQKIVQVFYILINCFSNSGKTIVLDDIFEKLDVQNSTKIINLILDEFLKSNFNLEILSHDENFITLFKNIANNRGDISDDIIETQTIYLDENKKPNFNNATDLLFTFDGYISNVCGHLKNNKGDDILKKHLLFIKYFNRRIGVNNFVQIHACENGNYENLNNNISTQIYEFLSENIFHYEKEININNYPLILSYFNDKMLLKKIDTETFYKILISEFKNENKKFGINLKNVSKYLEKMLVHIKEEKEYFMKNEAEYLKMKNDALKKKEKFYKKDFYGKMESRRDHVHKSKRNDLFHNLEISLSFMNDDE